MLLRIPLINLYSAPGFLDPSGDAPPVMNNECAAKLYSFLPAGTTFLVEDDCLTITYPDPGKSKRDEAVRLFERASKRAREGDHEKAIQQYEAGLAVDVLQTNARRDLAMSRMAKGDLAGTDAELRRLLLLAPADAWAWVILGNLNFRQNPALAERYFLRATELSPTDAYAWNGMGAMYSEKREYAKAVVAFETALKGDPRFVNAHLGLAIALADSGEPRRAFDALERLFLTSVANDTRSRPTFEQAGRYYRELAKRLAAETLETAEAEVDTLAREAERVSGYPVRFEDGEPGARIAASSEMAWLHGRDYHVVRVQEALDPAIKLHVQAHELCHIIMVTEARNAGTNRWFSSNEAGWALAQRELGGELGSIQRSLPPAAAEELGRKLFKGLLAQLFNLPLDMMIERRLATRHPALRFAQIQSISRLLEEAVRGCSDPDIVRLIPRRVVHASRFLNSCYAAFIDQQYAGALAAGVPFIQMGAMERGLKLFKLWEDAVRDFSPGREYDLVDVFARELRLQGWFYWTADTAGAAPVQGPEGATNPELLALKSPVAVHYFLRILKRFDAVDPEGIKHIAAESAMAGRTGLDYASPDKSYQVPTYGPEPLSGLEVMCIMFAAFQRVAPQHDIGIELHDAYQKALELHEAGKRDDD